MAAASKLAAGSPFVDPLVPVKLTRFTIFLPRLLFQVADAIFKFKIGHLSSECENTNTGITIGEFSFMPISVDIICSGREPPLKPYLGAGYNIYYYRSFKESDPAFSAYEGEHTRGWHLVGGAKYIPNKSIAINFFLNYEMITPFDFNSKQGPTVTQGLTTITSPVAEIDLSNISLGINLALRF